MSELTIGLNPVFFVMKIRMKEMTSVVTTATELTNAWKASVVEKYPTQE